MVLQTRGPSFVICSESPGGSTVLYDGGAFVGCPCGTSAWRRRIGDRRRCRHRARTASTLRRRRRRRSAEVDRRRFARRRRTAAGPWLGGSRRPTPVVGRLGVAWSWGRRWRVCGRLVRLAGEVVRLPVTMLAERATVARTVTTAARLKRFTTAVPTVLKQQRFQFCNTATQTKSNV